MTNIYSLDEFQIWTETSRFGQKLNTEESTNMREGATILTSGVDSRSGQIIINP